MWTLDALGVSITYESLYEPERGRAVTIGGLAAALLLAMIVNLLLGRGKAAQRIARNSGDMIECILYRALEESWMVAVDLESGKSYVGSPIESGITTTGGL